MKKCVRCGTENPDEKRWCEKCLAALPENEVQVQEQGQVQTEEHFCKHCGANIEETSSFCPNCGKKIQRTELKKKKSGKTGWLIGAIVAFVVAGLLLIAVFVSMFDNWEPPMVATEPTKTLETLPLQLPVSQAKPLLMEDTVDPDDYEDEETPKIKIFGQDIYRNQIAVITFLNTLENAPEDAWDVSKEKNGSVLAWTTPNGGLYNLYIGANGKVIAPKNCQGMFYGYYQARTIAFDGNLDTSAVTNMSSMFQDCRAVRELNLLEFDTKKVQDFSSMFQGCQTISKLDLHNFAPEAAKDLSLMFLNCYKVESVDLSGMDASGADIFGMFALCPHLQHLKLNKMDLSEQYDDEFFFMDCGHVNIQWSSKGADTKVTGCVGEVNGNWERYYLDNAQTHIYIFEEPLDNCAVLTINMEVEMNSGTNCKDWILWGRVNGTVQKIGDLYLPSGNGSGTQTLYFDKPLNLDGVVITPKVPGSYSYSMWYGIENVWLY